MSQLVNDAGVWRLQAATAPPFRQLVNDAGVWRLQEVAGTFTELVVDDNPRIVLSFAAADPWGADGSSAGGGAMDLTSSGGFPDPVRNADTLLGVTDGHAEMTSAASAFRERVIDTPTESDQWRSIEAVVTFSGVGGGAGLDSQIVGHGSATGNSSYGFFYIPSGTRELRFKRDADEAVLFTYDDDTTAWVCANYDGAGGYTIFWQLEGGPLQSTTLASTPSGALDQAYGIGSIDAANYRAVEGLVHFFAAYGAELDAASRTARVDLLNRYLDNTLARNALDEGFERVYPFANGRVSPWISVGDDTRAMNESNLTVSSEPAEESGTVGLARIASAGNHYRRVFEPFTSFFSTARVMDCAFTIQAANATGSHVTICGAATWHADGNGGWAGFALGPSAEDGGLRLYAVSYSDGAKNVSLGPVSVGDVVYGYIEYDGAGGFDVAVRKEGQAEQTDSYTATPGASGSGNLISYVGGGWGAAEAAIADVHHLAFGSASAIPVDAAAYRAAQQALLGM